MTEAVTIEQSNTNKTTKAVGDSLTAQVERRMKRSDYKSNKPSSVVQAIIDKGIPWTDAKFPPN